MKKFSLSLFIAHLIFFGLVVSGLAPRSLVIWETGILIVALALMNLEDGIVFFVRSIPLFIAIPLTASFDNFNQWRLFSIVIFCKWLFAPETRRYLVGELKLAINHPHEFFHKHPAAVALHALILLAFLSLWHSPDPVAGLKRIIYFVNAALIGVVAWNQAGRRPARLIRNLTVPVIIALAVGIIQVCATYLVDIYQFMRIWGEGIQLRQFGTEWSYIATHVGNTWFAYFGDQLSLRVFSLFPDSHSFPIFLLLGLPAFFAWSIQKPLARAERFWSMVRTRGSLAVLWIPAIFLFVILSGTRGFWAGAAAVVVWSFLVIWLIRHTRVPLPTRNVFKYVASYLTIFILLFSIAYPIFASPQFLVSKGNALLLQQRIKSILDFGETSNAQRILIWKQTLSSIEARPLLGVGIGNFPVVLDQDIKLSRAGSSAHNIYLHIAAEMGIPALLAALYLVWLILKTLYLKFRSSQNGFFSAYYAAGLISIPWVLAYLMTDVALFDERALLFFSVVLGILFAEEKNLA
ncbi:MAG TPA: O-antigen ligase family protein [Candidatus Paceibacterota bacterium]|nr:O-antigen ligase family protein [Candidatus Paceibacterota bacterium]